jgi:hypothetical protein
MALQSNAPLTGGVTATNAYVRVQSARTFKKADAAGYSLMVDVDVYSSKDERDKGASAQALLCPEMDKHKFPYSLGDESGSNLVTLAYTKLKSLDVYDGASDV